VDDTKTESKQPLDGTDVERMDRIMQKSEELITCLAEGPLDHVTAQQLLKRIDDAVMCTDPTALMRPPASGGNINSKHSLEQLLVIEKLDRRLQRKADLAHIVNRVVRIIIALLLISLGFGMIIMPAPPYFEMFTLFYINPNDGVTIMDLISLIVVFVGVAVFINIWTKSRR
jgi:hypothetical protein